VPSLLDWFQFSYLTQDLRPGANAFRRSVAAVLGILLIPFSSGFIRQLQTKKAGRSGGGMSGLVGEVPSGEEGKTCYIDGLLPAVGVEVLPPTVLVMRRTSTRRLSARPALVLLSSTGLSLPSPIT
jgi:hypothetical protein